MRSTFAASSARRPRRVRTARLSGAEQLREALALFRGEPLADYPDDWFARAESHRLAELRLATVEERVEADLQLGRHMETLPELERLVAQYPHRERLHAQLMVALYRAGLQAEALAAFGEARRVLADELGIEPSPALRRLERLILNQDAELAAPDVFAPTKRAAGARSTGIVTFLVARSEGDLEVARTVVGQGALWRFWYLKGHLTEGRRRLEDALAKDARRSPARAKALIGAAVMAVNCGDRGPAIRRAEEGVAVSSELGGRVGRRVCRLHARQRLHGRRIRNGRRSCSRRARAFRQLATTTRCCSSRATSPGWPPARTRETANPRIEASTLGALAAARSRPRASTRSGSARGSSTPRPRVIPLPAC
jgi:tetratricopeptide (TPR) repeat protein